MEDREIVQLYWDRNEDAIPQTMPKYGNYCSAVAKNILGDPLDAEECVNDAYMAAWNSIPPHRPERLATYVGKLVRNLAINRREKNLAAKRGGGEIALILDELSECVAARDSVEETVGMNEVTEAINAFLATLPARRRQIFVRRYWYSDSIAAIAERYEMGTGAVSMVLARVRKALQGYLSERGLDA